MTRCGYCLLPVDDHADLFDCRHVVSKGRGVVWIPTAAFFARATFPC